MILHLGQLLQVLHILFEFGFASFRVLERAFLGYLVFQGSLGLAFAVILRRGRVRLRKLQLILGFAFLRLVFNLRGDPPLRGLLGGFGLGCWRSLDVARQFVLISAPIRSLRGDHPTRIGLRHCGRAVPVGQIQNHTAFQAIDVATHERIRIAALDRQQHLFKGDAIQL